jgi:copper transport protein
MMYLSAMLVIGSCAFVLLIATRVSHLSGSYLEPSTVVPSTRLLARWAAVILAIAMIARLLAQGFMLGEGESLVIEPLLATTLWGWGWLVGAAGTLVVAGGLIFGHGRRAAWHVATVGTIAVALSFSLTGHATSASSPVLHVMLDCIHAMAAGGWLGTLLVVTTIGLRTVLMLPAERRGRAASELINAFSTFALLCGATLVLTGVLAAWSHLPTVPALWQTQYGQALFRKLVVISLMALVGAFNWRVIRPRLSNPDTISLLRKSAAVELAIGVVVVILTAILVGTSPPDSENAMPAAVRAIPTAVAPTSTRVQL